MPFLRAGFNGRNFDTRIRAWTRPVDGRRKFAPAELREFECGDFFWHGKGFLAWGEQCVIGSHYGFHLASEHQWNLPMCDVETRRERGRWMKGEWIEPKGEGNAEATQ